MPKVSICIATHNRVNLLPLAVESVLQQSYQDLELIVCDDGSTDNTPEFMDSLPDQRVSYIRHAQNIGKSNNMIVGFMAAKGEYFMKLDDDDRLTPDFLTKTCAVLDEDPSIDFVGTDHWIIDQNSVRDEVATQANSQKWGRATLPPGKVENLLQTVFVEQSFQLGATLLRRQALEDVGYMRPNLQNCEDNDLLVRLALAGKKGYYLPERLMEYRCHPEQQGTQRAIQYLTDQLNYLNSHQFGSEELETVRRSRIAGTQLELGKLLVKTGETEKGRSLTLLGASYSVPKALVVLGLSFLPEQWRAKAFNVLQRSA